jgi:hypothetical protein
VEVRKRVPYVYIPVVVLGLFSCDGPPPGRYDFVGCEDAKPVPYTPLILHLYSTYTPLIAR